MPQYVLRALQARFNLLRMFFQRRDLLRAEVLMLRKGGVKRRYLARAASAMPPVGDGNKSQYQNGCRCRTQSYVENHRTASSSFSGAFAIPDRRRSSRLAS